ncbi:creatininase family protein [Phycisphaera mikurensis]|uniref:Putative creatininase n=1 Tax=Phycisphaera mikurensis (strain NBRC 102666 / KCTC 22515 / FYK2301M01) TaxID=1142394 RepID=I0ICN6_PHYMF|nr:creatininase family protein [Phycisphaera mikurensis]MBB6442101.1 creatinine amidohydrolase [Phycisphaera mikurensis]BAM03024.1 putative creatininase [Phycisphaera mikurensis NBRC 102666]
MQWQHLRSDQIDATDRETVVVVPTAAIEQHSLHLPVSTDTTIVTEVCRRLDAACGDGLLVTPTLWLGCSRHHRNYPGTLTTALDHFGHALFDTVDSVLHAGFRNVLILNGHGGNGAMLSVTAEKLKYAWPDRRVAAASYWDVAGHRMAEVRESGPGGMGHAGEMETAVMLAIDPDRVDMSRAAADGIQTASPLGHIDMLGLGSGPGSVTRVRTFEEMTDHGGFGDPTTATAEKGERFLAVIVESLEAAVEDLAAGRL